MRRRETRTARDGTERAGPICAGLRPIWHRSAGKRALGRPRGSVDSKGHGEGRQPGPGAGTRYGSEAQCRTPAAPWPAPFEDRARPRRRRLHRRRLRDRRAARPRPAGREPHGQPVRRLRRHERRLLRGGPRGQRDHARRDDARRQPAGSDALPRHRRRHRPAAQPARLRQDRGAAALADGEARPRTSRRSGARSARWTSRSGSPTTCRPASTRAPASRPTCATSCRTPTAPTTSARSTTSSTSRRPTSTPASGSSSAPTAGTTCRSRAPCAPRRRCRWSTSPSRSTTASSSTAASSRRRTSTSPSTPARSS